MGDVFNLEAWRTVIVSALSELGANIAGFIPNFVGMLVILLIGWILARFVQVVSGRVLARAGLDRASERLGVPDTLGGAGIERTPSALIARLLFWLLMLTFVLSAVETLGLTAVTATIDRLIAYLPKIIGASLIVLLGLLLARFVGNVVGSGAAAANMPYARSLGAVARGAMVIMVGILAVEQLGVDAALLLWAAITVLAALMIGLALAFALGSREVVGAILAGYYLRKSLREGTAVDVGGRQGTLARVGPIDTLFRSGETSWSVPNQQLLQSVIDRQNAA